MLAQSWALGFVCAFFGIAAGTATGCSSKHSDATSGSSDGNADDSNSGAATRSAQNQPDDGEEYADAGSTTADAGSQCNPNAVDDPDDDFIDSNCDGIDGDKKKAVFVATTAGNDSADGTWGNPVATLKHGIDLAISANKDVYVCKGDYKEGTIQLATKGVRVYGGYDCTQNWTRNSVSQLNLASTSNTAVSINNVTDPVVFDHVDIASANATTGGDSSIVALVVSSTNVTLRRGTYTAGAAADAVQPATKPQATNSIPACAAYVYPDGCYGEHGTDAYQYKNCFYDTTQGATYYGNAPFTDTSVFQLAIQSDVTQTNKCKNSSSLGGRGGGTNASQPLQGTNGTQGSPASTTGTLDGANGVSATAVSGATQGFGTLNSTGYVPSNQGAVGNDGLIGQAGTGGYGGGFTTVFQTGANEFQYYLYAPNPGGGKGGWGGCGGDGGDGGNAGGASIAVATYQSQVTLERLTLTTSNGGKGSAGGLGGAGVTGQPGGSPGTAHYQCAQCVASENSICSDVNKTNTGSAQFGGKGGKGGDGGQGGPGGGGPSVPLVISGTTPSLSAVTFLPGSGGPGGSNESGPRVADGESADQKVLP